MFKFKSDIMKMASFVSSDNTRRPLKYISIRYGVLEATNGYIYVKRAIFPEEIEGDAKESKDITILLSPSILKSAFSLANKVRKFAKHIFISKENNIIKVIPSGDKRIAMEYVEEEGPYPKTDRIHPQGDPEYTIALNADYVKCLAELSKLATGYKRVTLKFYGKTSPVVFETEKYSGIIMPLRVGDDS